VGSSLFRLKERALLSGIHSSVIESKPECNLNPRVIIHLSVIECCTLERNHTNKIPLSVYRALLGVYRALLKGSFLLSTLEFTSV